MEWLFLITNIPERGHYLGPAGLTVPHLYHVEPDASPSCIQSIIEKDFHIQSVVTCLDGSIRTQLGVCVCVHMLFVSPQTCSDSLPNQQINSPCLDYH